MSALWWDLVKGLLLVGGLALLARFIPQWLGRKDFPGRRRHLRLLDSLHLGPDRSIHLVQVGSIRLVLASSRSGVAVLREIEGDHEEAGIAGGQPHEGEGG